MIRNERNFSRRRRYTNRKCDGESAFGGGICSFAGLFRYGGTAFLKEHRPDLILLDLMLPGFSGEEILPEIRDIPVIVISAKTETDSKVKLLLGGAEDYMTKPFSVMELLARVAVQLRRGKPVPAAGLLRFQEIELDTGKRSVKVSGVSVKLTKTEYAVLKLLMRNPSQVMTRSVLLDEISGDSPDGVESSLKVHVSNLRRKLREVGGKDYIESVWGIGFKMREED